METWRIRTVTEKEGYIRQRMLGGILILRLMDSRRETINAWYEDCSLLMSKWQPGQRLRYLHDVREAEVVTPYAVDRVVRVVRQMRQIPVTDGRGAILVNSSTLAELLSTFLKRRTLVNWQIRFFQDEDEALRWLSE
jgi:hypothetical protein